MIRSAAARHGRRPRPRPRRVASMQTSRKAAEPRHPGARSPVGITGRERAPRLRGRAWRTAPPAVTRDAGAWGATATQRAARTEHGTGRQEVAVEVRNPVRTRSNRVRHGRPPGRPTPRHRGGPLNGGKAPDLLCAAVGPIVSPAECQGSPWIVACRCRSSFNAPTLFPSFPPCSQPPPPCGFHTT